jgi:hypothetical protein
VKTSTGNVDSDQALRRFMDDTRVQGNPEAVEELIAYVLRRAHQMAQGSNASHEARAILHVAHSFADELATANPRFDRLRFIMAVREVPA